MRTLLLLAFVAVAQCALLGSRKCTWGPSYWCSHVDHARECGSMQHCMDTVWKNQLQGLTGSVEGCYEVVKILNDIRKAGPNMLQEMAQRCTEMTEERRSLCKELMTNSQNEVQLLLKSDLPSVNVATALGLCGSFSPSVAHPQVDNKQDIHKSGNYCTDCLNFFGDLRDIVNKTEGKLAQQLKNKVCTKLGFFENLCNETVDTYSDFIRTILVQQLNPEDICFLFQLCASETRAELMESARYIAAKAKLHQVECDLCEDVAKEVQNAVRDSALQKEIMSTLEDKVCPMLPGDLAAQCKSYVAQYGPMVFEVLVAELDPATICQTLGFCSGAEMNKKPALVTVPLGKAVTTVRLLSPEPQEQAQSGVTCELCEAVVEKLGSLITANATEAEIVAAMEKVCSLLPASLKSDCDGFIEKYGKEIVQLLKRVAPDAVCTALGLCLGDKAVQSNLPVPEVNSGELCLVCELIASRIKQYIGNPNHTQTIEDFMDTVCDILPVSYQGMCKGIIDTYAPVLIDELNKYDDPKEVCTKLELCDDSVKAESNKSGGDSAADKPLLFMPMAELQPALPHLDCSQGPDVWCSTMEAAKRCDAVKYCVEKQKLKLDE